MRKFWGAGILVGMLFVGCGDDDCGGGNFTFLPSGNQGTNARVFEAIGENQSETFFVAAGTTNFNTNVHTETFVNRTPTTVNAAVKGSVYQVVGVSRP